MLIHQDSKPVVSTDTHKVGFVPYHSQITGLPMTSSSSSINPYTTSNTTPNITSNITPNITPNITTNIASGAGISPNIKPNHSPNMAPFTAPSTAYSVPTTNTTGSCNRPTVTPVASLVARTLPTSRATPSKMIQQRSHIMYHPYLTSQRTHTKQEVFI